MDDVVKELRTGFGLLSKDIQLLIRSGGEAMRMGATSATKIFKGIEVPLFQLGS